MDGDNVGDEMCFEGGDESELVPDMDHSDIGGLFNDIISEDDILRTIENPLSDREQFFTEEGVSIGLGSGTLAEQLYNIVYQQQAEAASVPVVVQIRCWEDVLVRAQLKSDTESPTGLMFSVNSTVLPNSVVFEAHTLNSRTLPAETGPSVHAVAKAGSEGD